MSQPDILIGESATVGFDNYAKLAFAMQRYGWTVKQGEQKDGVQARNSCKHIVGDNIHQPKNHKID